MNGTPPEIIKAFCWDCPSPTKARFVISRKRWECVQKGHGEVVALRCPSCDHIAGDATQTSKSKPWGFILSTSAGGLEQTCPKCNATHPISRDPPQEPKPMATVPPPRSGSGTTVQAELEAGWG